MTIKFNDLKALHKRIFDEKFWAALKDVVLDSQYIGGDYVEMFEAKWAAYCGTEFCISCANGTDALELALEAILEIYAGRSIKTAIVPDMTFFATAEAVRNVGLVPVIVDIDPNGFMDSVYMKQALRTYPESIIIPVHLWGRPGDVGSIKETAYEYLGTMLEDCAQAHGAKYQDDGNSVGSAGIASTFSFYPGKNLGALGDGGAIITDSYEINSFIRKRKNHGKISKFEHRMWGRNSRLDALQAYTLLYKLQFLNEWNSARRKIATLYYEGLKDLEEVWVPGESFQGSVFHVFPIRVNAIHRLGFMKYMESKGIELGIHLPIAISDIPPVKGYPYFGAGVAKSMASELVSLPIHPLMGEKEVYQVVFAIRDFFKGKT